MYSPKSTRFRISDLVYCLASYTLQNIDDRNQLFRLRLRIFIHLIVIAVDCDCLHLCLQKEDAYLLIQIPWKRKTKPRHRVPEYRYKSHRYEKPNLSVSRIRSSNLPKSIDADEIEIEMEAGDASAARVLNSKPKNKQKRAKFIPSAEHCG